jgi:hypothetical protein
MSRYLSLTSIIFLFLIVSCQKEKSFEQGKASKGSLQGNFGDCLAKTINGTYTATKSLADTNSIDVDVDVTQTGRYTIYTDTVNGYFFQATGTFSSIGSNTVHLKGFGTPGSAGTNDFIVFFDSSFCNLSVTVLPNSGSSGGTAVYSLQQGAGGSCMNATPAGTFTQGAALTSANKITIDVNVTATGTWNVTTSTIAGISFSGSGTFTTTGNQTITLTASGNPNASGDQSFPVTVGTSSCSFIITGGAGTNPPPTSSDDYFPLTQNSYWTYDDGAAGDTLKTIINGTATKGGKTYQRFVTTYESGPPNDTAFYRKDAASSYYTFVDTAGFGALGVKFTQVGLDVLFLKNSLTTGATWNSDFNATLSGFPVTVRFKSTCTNANASVTVNGVSYTNVYQISSVVQIGTAGTFTDIFSLPDSYYAKGVGLIEASDPFLGDQVIRYYKVF